MPLTVYGVLDCYASMSAMGPDVASTLLYTCIYAPASQQSYKTFWRCNFSRSSNDKSRSMTESKPASPNQLPVVVS